MASVEFIDDCPQHLCKLWLTCMHKLHISEPSVLHHGASFYMYTCIYMYMYLYMYML